MPRDYELRIVGPLTTVNLHSTPYTIIAWAPAHAAMDVESIPSTRDGEAVRSVRWQNVIEQIQVRIEDGSMANNLAELEHIEHFFERARQQQADPSLDEAVSLQFKSSSSGLNFNASYFHLRYITSIPIPSIPKFNTSEFGIKSSNKDEYENFIETSVPKVKESHRRAIRFTLGFLS